MEALIEVSFFLFDMHIFTENVKAIPRVGEIVRLSTEDKLNLGTMKSYKVDSIVHLFSKYHIIAIHVSYV